LASQAKYQQQQLIAYFFGNAGVFFDRKGSSVRFAIRRASLRLR
jgi:hypothetical protein